MGEVQKITCVIARDRGFSFSRLDKQEKLRGRPGRGASIFEAPRSFKVFSTLFRMPRSRCLPASLFL